MMALLDFIFNLSKNERVIPFSKIAGVTGLELGYVEMILMRAMSLQLIKGLINQVRAVSDVQVDQTVTVTWIQPQVLDEQRISATVQKVELWQKGLG